MKSLRLPIIILSLLCVIFLIFGAWQFVAREQEKKNREVSERTLDEITQAKEQLQKELDDQKKVKGDLESQLSELTTKVQSLQMKAETLAAQIADERKAKEEALAQLENKDKEIEDAMASVENEKSARTSLQEQFEKMKKEYLAVQDELKTVKINNEDLSKQLQELQARGAVELDKIVVKPGAGIEGKVLVVNKEFNFIVVGAGNNKGITPGVVFGIYRGGTLVGKAKVEKVYETMSAANIMPDSGDIREQDIAKVM